MSTTADLPSRPARFSPKLITVFKEGYSKQQFVSDLIAGIIVGIVALPLAIAFAIASGVKPEQGLYTAVIAGIAASLLGGSRAQITGPTGAFIVIVYGIVQQYGYNGLAVATFIAGFLLIAMGLAGLGAVLRFIPYPVTIGFTSGIALIIFSSQIPDLFGLKIAKVPSAFIGKWISYAENFGTFNSHALLVGVISIVIVFLWPRITHRIPGSLVAIVAATIIVHAFHLPVDTIGSRFGSVPNHLPAPALPSITWGMIPKLFSPAITIALLGAIESLLSAVVADGMLGTRHRSNTELVAQGVGNVLSPIFLGIPATGAIARTATNIKNGGRTPVSGIVHALTLLIIMMFAGHYASLIPMPALAGILIYVAYNMSEWQTFLQTLRSPKGDVAVLLVTFFLTILIDLTVAIEVGVILAAFLFMQKMADVTQVGFKTRELQREMNEDEDLADPKAISKKDIPHGVEVFEIYGSLFFAAVDQFKDALRRVEKTPKILILRMRHVLAMDATGLKALEDLLKKMKKDKAVLILSGVHAQPLVVMDQAGFLDKIGKDNLQADIDTAIERAREILAETSK
jgi:sulfate permease, SulP family